MSKELGYETQAQELLQNEINSCKVDINFNTFRKTPEEKQKLAKAKFDWRKEQKTKE